MLILATLDFYANETLEGGLKKNSGFFFSPSCAWISFSESKCNSIVNWAQIHKQT